MSNYFDVESLPIEPIAWYKLLWIKFMGVKIKASDSGTTITGYHYKGKFYLTGIIEDMFL